MRITREQALAEIVKTVARRTTCPRREVGALLVRAGRILSTGFNGAPSGLPHCDDAGCIIGADGGCLRTVHAEANAIAFAARQGIRTEGATLWTTVAPCLNCAKLIINAGIIKIISLEPYRDQNGWQLLDDANVETSDYAQKP